MRYISTRAQSPPVSFLDAVLSGMAPDGGLYVPEAWPSSVSIGRPSEAPYSLVATRVLEAFAPPESLSESPYYAMAEVYDEAFASRAVTPLIQHGPGEWLLELFHGPSLSFKDIAMQLIAPLYQWALKQRDARLTVVCATSGDTGGAAAQALKHRERIDLFVLTPRGRVSEVQRRFMTTTGVDNVHVSEVDGDFDQCQALVKALFADADFAAQAALSGVNSINFARIVAQAVYYYMAADALGREKPVNFCVPTGNFGDAFSGYAASRLGAPLGMLLLATNANDVLFRALDTGLYERSAASVPTLSPAMDIQVASNFERMVFESVGRDGAVTAHLYEQFRQYGRIELPPKAHKAIERRFDAFAVDDEQTLSAMAEFWRREGRLVCPHTAVGLAAARHMIDLPHEHVKGDTDTWEAHMITLATAHPAKFPDAVERATGVRPSLPHHCADLFDRPEKFDSLPADVEAVKRYIRERSRAWQ